MNFKKIDEIIIRPKEKECLGWFMIRIFNFENERNEEEVMRHFILSKYFVWQEEFRDNVHVSTSSAETLTDWNFHGLYDIKKIDSNDFEKVELKSFKEKFIIKITKEIGQFEELKQIEKILDTYNSFENKFYILKDLEKDKIHKWTVFYFFLSGLIINHIKKTIILVEVGLD